MIKMENKAVKKYFYLCLFILLLILQLTLIMVCFISGARETEEPSVDYAQVFTSLLITSPISIMIIISAVIVFARYRDKKENEEIKKYRKTSNF